MNLADKSTVIDKEACKKHIKEAIKDKTWEPIVQSAFTKCLAEGPKYGEQYQKITGISVETCDFKFDAISDCIDIASFGVSQYSFNVCNYLLLFHLEMPKGLVDKER